MQIHNIKRRTKNRKPASVGRGGKRGKTSGRGTKGQKARAGRKLRPELRDIIKRLPKKRGYFFKGISEKPFPVNVGALEALFKAKETVSPETLVAKGLVHKVSDRYPKVKILGDGAITKALTISGCDVSLGAKVKLEKAGGTIA